MVKNLKNIMDAETLLFIKNDGTAYGFNRDYYRQNNHQHTSEVADVKYILYKVNGNRDSWIDLDKAIHLKTGDYNQRISAAFLDSQFKITDITIIPETIYTDVSGYRHTITPMDGLYDANFWMQRITFKDFVSAEWTGLYNDDLKITFDVSDNITNAMISLNSFFYHYEVPAYNVIIFRNIKQHLTKIRTTGDIKNQYDLKVNVYAWDGLEKKAPIYPQQRLNQWLTLPRVINYNCFVVYNGVIYDYELDESNYKRIKLKGININALVDFKLDEVKVYEMATTSTNIIAKKYLTHGIGNKYENSVDFVLPLQDSMILYNGIDNEYEIFTLYSIQYPPTLFSVSSVSSLNHIYEVSFMRGR